MKTYAPFFLTGFGVFLALLFISLVLSVIPVSIFWVLHGLLGLNEYLSAWILSTLYGLSLAGASLAKLDKKKS
jgi:hypothetical protein